MSIYNCTVSELQCNAAITIANIEGGKLACAHTQNIQNVGFSHIRSHIQLILQRIITEHSNPLQEHKYDKAMQVWSIN